jgi:hypothetical protein
MLNIVRQMRGAMSLNDLLLLIAIVLFIPSPLAFPLAAHIVSKRINHPAHIG